FLYKLFEEQSNVDEGNFLTNLTGKDLALSILNGFNSCGINCDNIYGQGYGGASNIMSVHIKGVQTIIRAQYPKALYVHCVAHTLNLAVLSACNIQPIRNC
ncbi:zinc finger MYM-type protein 1-like, partial [Aphis craccivora]